MLVREGYFCNLKNWAGSGGLGRVSPLLPPDCISPEAFNFISLPKKNCFPDLASPPTPRSTKKKAKRRPSQMVKAYTQEHVYCHPWERVTSASWRKFTDPANVRTLSHILSVETLNRRLDSHTGRLYITRSITVHAPGPWFVRKIIGQDICHCIESSVVDARSRSMEITTRNISLRNFLEVQERSWYAPHPDNPGEWTAFRQETSIRCKPLSALASMAEKVEQRCAERFQQNSVKGREVMERICKYLEAESRGMSI